MACARPTRWRYPFDKVAMRVSATSAMRARSMASPTLVPVLAAGTSFSAATKARYRRTVISG